MPLDARWDTASQSPFLFIIFKAFPINISNSGMYAFLSPIQHFCILLYKLLLTPLYNQSLAHSQLSTPTVPNIPCCLDYFLPPIHTVRPQEFSFGLALCLTISPFRLHVSFPNDFSMGRSGTSVACGSILCSAKCIHTKARTSADMAPESHSSPFRMLHPQSLAQQFRMSRIVSFASPHLPSLYSTPMRLAVRAPFRARIVGVEFRRHSFAHVRFCSYTMSSEHV